MNLNTLNVHITPCAVCNYPFSDKHHIWPQSRGGKSLPTIALCPNHHRFANLVQAMIMQRMEDDQIKAFAYDFFDFTFNASVLTQLIEQQRELVWDGWMLEVNKRIKEQCPGTTMDWIDVMLIQNDEDRSLVDPVEYRKELHDSLREALLLMPAEEFVMIPKLFQAMLRYLEATE
jgi:hypothetical protein